MNKYVVLGVNENPKYLYYLPLIRWAWRQFGWDVFMFYVGTTSKLTDLVEEHSPIDVNIKTAYQYKSETIAQCCRMYACEFMDDILMTSDADMLPLSNYWHPSEDGITCYNRDLSSEHFPMCYVSMPYSIWEIVMDVHLNDPPFDAMFRDLAHFYPRAKNKWCVDQDILTWHLNNFKDKVLINRGTDLRTGYPIGRVDRSHWTLDHKQLIDAHLPHDILTNEKSFHNVMQLLHTVWPKEDWKWFINYTKEFKKLL